MIKKVIKKCVGILELLPKKYIIFESKPDFSDNTWAVFEYIRKSPLFKKYKLIWITQKEEKQSGIKNVCLQNRALYYYYNIRSKAIVFCNQPISKKSKNQISFYLCHGSKSKKTRGKYEAPKDLDYILVQADVFKESVKYEYNLSEKTQMVTLGYPRNDDLLAENKIDFKSILNADYKKMIVWYPTFRQHKNGNAVSKITLPIIYDEKSAEKLNESAKDKGVLIVLKPHFAQDTSYIKDNNYSNIKIINDVFLKENNIRSYQLIAASDALLTDYSSIYYDYLLKDKPIGLVWEDYEEYKKNQGFALDPDMIYSGGEKIYNVQDFCDFVERVANEQDVLKEQRNEIKKLTNVYFDANSSARVAKFIFEKISENKR